MYASLAIGGRFLAKSTNVRQPDPREAEIIGPKPFHTRRALLLV